MTGQGYRIAAVLVVAAPGEDDRAIERRTIDYELVDPTIARFRGRVLSLSPGRTLVEFAEVTDALAAGLEIQRGMAERNAVAQDGDRIELRLGLDLGEIFEEQGQLQGVATAERLAGTAQPGAVALSVTVFRHLRPGALAAEFTRRVVDGRGATDGAVEVIDARAVTPAGAQSPWIARRHWTLLSGMAVMIMLLVATLVLWRPLVELLFGDWPTDDQPRLERPAEEGGMESQGRRDQWTASGRTG